MQTRTAIKSSKAYVTDFAGLEKEAILIIFLKTLFFVGQVA